MSQIGTNYGIINEYNIQGGKKHSHRHHHHHHHRHHRHHRRHGHHHHRDFSQFDMDNLSNDMIITTDEDGSRIILTTNYRGKSQCLYYFK